MGIKLAMGMNIHNTVELSHVDRAVDFDEPTLMSQDDMKEEHSLSVDFIECEIVRIPVCVFCCDSGFRVKLLMSRILQLGQILVIRCEDMIR
jgi:hypothetical protein